MPSGRTHTHMTTAITIALAATGHPVEALGAAAGWLLSPDLDVDAGYYGLHIVRVIAGEAAATVWRWYWLPYAVLMPHRSVLSHMPALGTALRIAYAIAPWALAMALAGRWGEVVRAVSTGWLWRAAVGLAIADAVHAAADAAVTAWRRLR